ncbi:FimV/HubP family polar landmark protein, partial [Marinospirillum sp.]|uniref:FimV/HubP family polar landmark protein n=1 Tax=Marinospirillum sp. TaxID=2183934 RepID=UPI0028700BE4
MRSWRSFLIMAGFALVPLSVAATDKATDFLWEGSQLHSTPAALTAEELATATAQTSTRSSSGQNRISVGPRDTLWSIARTNRPARNITIKQAMLAIRDANPSAFPTGNINEMEAGSSLIIPSATAMRSRTALQAEEAVRRQNQAWVA